MAGTIVHFAGTDDVAIVADIRHRGMQAADRRGNIRADICRAIPIKGIESPLVLAYLPMT